MPHITHDVPVSNPVASQTPSSIGEPVAQVLGRIQVRDPKHKPSGIYGRRMEDYETHAPILLMTLVFTLVVLVANPFGSNSRRPLPLTRNPLPAIAPVVAARGTSESLSIPQRLHPHPQAVVSSLRETPEALPYPENLRANFLGPRMIEFQWDAISPGYTYRLYRVQDQNLVNPILLSDIPLRSPFMAWTADDGMEQAWVAVKGIDPQGHETDFSRPLRVRLPS